MAAFIIALLVMYCSLQFCDCCSTGDTSHPIFFMSIDSFIGYIEPNQLTCICDNLSCPINCSSNCRYDLDRIYWIHSNEDVYGITGNATFGEMFNAMRDDYLGTEYVASVYLDVSGQSFLGVGNPTSSAITVDITLPQVNQFSLVKCENESIALNLQPFEAKTLKFNCDITGTHINGSGNIIVYVAAFSLIAPNSASSLQFMIEQLIPINQWATFYAVVPYGENAYGDVICVVTSQPDTFVHILGYDYITIPHKYESIRRRIDGKRPISVRSSKPVGVTQFSINMHDKTVMSICIPITTDTHIKALTYGNYNYLRYAVSENVTEDNLPLSRFVANREDNSLTNDIFGCSVYNQTEIRFGGTFCGYLQNTANYSNRDWPRMDPGDGKDNDGDGSIDEDDCYSNFDPNADVQDCSKEGSAVSRKEYFIIPVKRTLSVTGIRCRSTSPSFNTIFYKSANSGTWRSAINEANDVLRFELVNNTNKPLIIQSNSSSKLHLLCNYVCLVEPDCSNSFYVPPINMLGSRYIASVPPCPDGSSSCESTCSISQVFNNTVFGFVKTLASNDIRLMNNEMFTESIKDGNFIESEYPIAALCHSKTVTENIYLVQFLLPFDIAGFTYNLLKTDYLVDEKLHVWATDSNTVVNLIEYDVSNSTNVSQHMLIQYAGDSIMIDLSSDDAGTLYSLSSNKPVNVIAHIKRNSSSLFSDPYNSHNYNIVRVPSSSNIVSPTDGTNLTVSGVTYHHISDNGWPHRSNFIKEERNKPNLNRFQEPGDGKDNDRDGLFDEEYCGFLSEDNPVEENTLHDIDLDGSYNEDCMGCGGGQRLEPMLVCTLCDIGTFREHQSKIDKCISCGENLTTFEIGSVSYDECVPHCVEGMELNNATMVCEPCQIGFYKNISANDSMFDINERFWCLPCPDGLTTYDFGTIHNFDCIAHCEAGEELVDIGGCQYCEVGFYKDLSSNDTTASVMERWNCTPCGTNKTTFYNRTVSETECIAPCTEGMELNNVSTVCEPCELGFYKEVSANDTSLSVGERFWCLQCPSNLTTRDVGTKDFAGCIAHCGTGQYLKNGTCAPCDIGFYKNTSSEDIWLTEKQRWHCSQCPAGLTTNSTGAHTCIPLCPIGKEFVYSSGKCEFCKMGFYKNISGSHIECFQCPVNFTTRYEGAIDFQDCKIANCKCPCDRVNEEKNYTSEELSKIIEEMKNQLILNRAYLSATLRKKISVMDYRPSAQSIGYVGAIIIAFVFGLLLVIDIVILKQHLSMFFRNLRSLFC